MSSNMLAPFSICYLQLRKWVKKPEIYAVLICISIFMYSKVIPIKEMIMDTGVRATPFLFPFLFSDPYMGFFILIGSIVAFADAPFWDISQSTSLVRVGRSSWIVGQLLYLLTASIIYILFVFLVSILLMYPSLILENEWGSIWQTLAQTDAAILYKIELAVPYSIICNYTPLQAVGVEFLMGTLVSFFIGILIFTINFNFNKKAGVGIASFLVLLAIRASSMHPWVIRVLPTYWVRISALPKEKVGIRPTISGAIICLITINILLIVIILIRAYRRDLK